MARLKVLAIAVATGRVGHVFLDDGVLIEWKASKKAAKSTKNARKHIVRLIKRFKPNVIITERTDKLCRKGDHAKGIITAIAKVAEDAELLDVSVPRLRAFKNKYAEAREFVLRFPELRPRLPKEPRIWESEPFGTIYFEALAMALLVIDRRVAN